MNPPAKKIYDHGDVIIRFSGVSFNFGHNHPILDEADFSVREGAKMTLMGQNGAGKTTLFQLIDGTHEPEDGAIHIKKGSTIAVGKQVVTKEQRTMTVKEFFVSAFDKKVYDIDPRIEEVLEVVHLKADMDKEVGKFSGGQQARLLLAHALIQKPDILLLDEPTNNLDKQGIDHLTKFLIDYKNTCIVISHDAQFLNAFTHGVLYLDVFTKKIEQYVGDYLDVVKEIAARIERERMKNVRLERDIANRKEQMGFFAQKGGHMRDVAKKMREAIEELEEEIVDMRQEDKTIGNFVIPAQPVDGIEMTEGGPVVTITAASIVKDHKAMTKKTNVIVRRKSKLLVAGPNGIGKTTFLEALASGAGESTPTHDHNSDKKSGLRPRKAGVGEGAVITKGVKVGYYRQDFSGLDYDMTVYRALSDVMAEGTDQQLRSTASRFFITAEQLNKKVGSLSEGQKGLLCFARFVLQRPGLLIMDEPTNHINFRHLPVIAKALDEYQGALILVSHAPEFVKDIKITEILDLGAL